MFLHYLQVQFHPHGWSPKGTTIRKQLWCEERSLILVEFQSEYLCHQPSLLVDVADRLIGHEKEVPLVSGHVSHA